MKNARDDQSERHQDESVESRIAKLMPTLTPAHRRVAEFVRTNLVQAATMRIDEFAAVVNVSVATANRFARALGFDGYPQFRAALIPDLEAVFAPVERLRSALESPMPRAQTVGSALAREAQSIDACSQSVDSHAVEQFVSALVEANRVFIIGYGSSGYLASLMEHGLSPYLRGVQALSLGGGPEHAARRLFDVTERDVVVAIAFPRYVRDTIALAVRARESGARLAALTDGLASPLASVADIRLFISAKRQLTACSNATILAHIEALCDAVAGSVPESAASSKKMTEFALPWLYRSGRG
ncbi:MurR/RpiR family transcriptional regulator [Burkholderia pseudomultivorans]|uniref:HTH-type transcriptional regulator HexR n=1 Tax=Burkholderia pseudomultivorans TaxID=1207504 RepID=A0ABU2E3H5_9BURK|nr:MurR/RpiR family transcriptional regulator [Burkholderia pseudomultivorans]MDR8732128.1 HTH-type transcriptional regulator HexR [Burkholderia pseudomultivorans]MDR8737056.1 HTH-type transcriptional regulator HexR [Burkholderia pseudomultivorans]MDR8743049.1 HTH-type transcriptional regulator HexR [Burkholderia pseudomultivorans]MDR8754423.1 HTH-type transcriptional regulator HexR [Burkholderia pseudomultivorans]MDR8779776.1 HTH-type transcriptional regulator HexR [Burkholderia pseudomultivo